MPRRPTSPSCQSVASPESADHRSEDRETRLRNEYLGALLLACCCLVVSALLMMVSRRHPTSWLGELATDASETVSFAVAIVSLAFVVISLKAASAQIWLLIRRIRTGRR